MAVKWPRRRRRVDVGTYVAPEPVAPPSIDEQIEDGVLVAFSAARLAVTNSLILRSLRDGHAYDDRRVRLLVTAELLSLALEKERDAERVRAMRTETLQRTGRAAGPADYRARDAVVLERRATVSEGLAARLAVLATDPQAIGELAERAHRSFLDEFEVSVARGASAFDEPDLDRPMGVKDRAAELKGLAADLEELARHRRE